MDTLFLIGGGALIYAALKMKKKQEQGVVGPTPPAASPTELAPHASVSSLPPEAIPTNFETEGDVIDIQGFGRYVKY
jgi:hypothetical protein